MKMNTARQTRKQKAKQDKVVQGLCLFTNLTQWNKAVTEIKNILKHFERSMTADWK